MNPNQIPPTNPNLQQGLTQQQVQGQIQQNIQGIGQLSQQAATIPQQYNPANDPQIQGLRSNYSDKIKQLFDHDTQLATVYRPVQSAPGPSQTPVAMPDNGQQIIDPSIGLRSATNQQISTAGEMADILKSIATQKDTLKTNQDAATQLLLTGIKAKEDAMSGLTSMNTMNTDALTSLLSVLGKTGGTIPDSVGSYFGIPSGTTIPSELGLQIALEKAKYNITNQPLDQSVFDAMAKDPRYATLVPLLKGMNPAEQKALVGQIIQGQVPQPVKPTQVQTVTPPTIMDYIKYALGGPKPGTETSTSFQGQTAAIGSVKLVAPNGKIYDVPLSEKEESLNNGWKPYVQHNGRNYSTK